MAEFATRQQLESRIDTIRQSPGDNGTLEMIIRRPDIDEREAIPEGALTIVDGLEGDSWRTRGSSQTSDGSAHPDTQLTLMNSRAATAIAGDRDRWSLAGDQLYVDLDLSTDNLPAGTRLAIGGAVVVVTAEPHTGCRKFAQRFGTEAVQFVNSAEGRRLNLRGINARVETAGPIRVGDIVKKIGVL